MAKSIRIVETPDERFVWQIGEVDNGNFSVRHNSGKWYIHEDSPVVYRGTFYITEDEALDAGKEYLDRSDREWKDGDN